MYTYCLFCQTQRCKTIAQLLEIKGVDRAFSPQIIRRFRKKGVNVDLECDLLPGYVFLYHEEAITDPRFFYGIDGIIRQVGSVEETWQLKGSDLEFATRLLEKNGRVGTQRVFLEGETVILTDPLFLGCQGHVTKLDIRKQRARVDFVFNGTDCHTWIAFECDEETDKEKKEETIEEA